MKRTFMIIIIIIFVCELGKHVLTRIVCFLWNTVRPDNAAVVFWLLSCWMCTFNVGYWFSKWLKLIPSLLLACPFMPLLFKRPYFVSKAVYLSLLVVAPTVAVESPQEHHNKNIEPPRLQEHGCDGLNLPKALWSSCCG